MPVTMTRPCRGAQQVDRAAKTCRGRRERGRQRIDAAAFGVERAQRGN